MPPVMFSVITKYHKGRHSLFLYNSEIFYAFTQDILRSLQFYLDCYLQPYRLNLSSLRSWRRTLQSVVYLLELF